MPGAYVYIVSNLSHRVYTGMTTDLVNRIREHKEKRFPNGFTARYRFDRLVYFVWLPTTKEAAAREKQIKSWRREKKLALIEAKNPDWDDLSANIGAMLKLR